MKQALITTALLAAALSVPAYAQRAAMPAGPLETCDNVSLLGGMVMAQRQANEPMGDVMRVAMRSDLPNVMTFLVRSAYARTRYDSDADKADAVRDFENDVYGVCIAEFTQ